MKMLLVIALGGAMGALGRYATVTQVSRWLGVEFPYGTLAVNILGSVILGFLVETLALKAPLNEELRGFLVIGLLGAFTTFSTFSLDVVLLLQRHAYLTAGGYIIANVAVCVGGLFLAMILARQIWT